MLVPKLVKSATNPVSIEKSYREGVDDCCRTPQRNKDAYEVVPISACLEWQLCSESKPRQEPIQEGVCEISEGEGLVCIRTDSWKKYGAQKVMLPGRS